MNSGLKSLVSVLDSAGAGEHVGDQIYWSVFGVDMTPESLRDLFVQAGLPESLLPDVPDSEQAFRRAASKMKVRKNAVKAGGGQHEILRLIEEDGEKILYAVVREDKVANGSSGNVQTTHTLDHDVVDRIAYLKDHCSVVSDNESAIACEIRTLHGQFIRRVKNEDIQSMLLDAVQRWDGIPIRANGGVYFIPYRHRDEVQAMASVIASIGCDLGVLNLYGTDQTKGALGKAAQKSLEARIVALNEEIESFDDTTRQATLDKRAEKLRSLREQVGLYAEVLNMSRDGLLSGIRKLEKKVMDKLLS